MKKFNELYEYFEELEERVFSTKKGIFICALIVSPIAFCTVWFLSVLLS
jgi:hypothetical protein